MQAMATSLSDDDIKNLAAYYASLSPVSAGGDVDLAKLGQNKATMCLGCHGSTAEGNGQFPRLAGQQPDYLLAQLNAFKAGERKSGPMQAFVGIISEANMKALAAYFGTIK
jgi:cytochrome c553